MAFTSELLTNTFFEVTFAVEGVTGIVGRFTKVSGLQREITYEPYYEGGSTSPHMLYDKPKMQTLVLEQGIITHSADLFGLWMTSMAQGMYMPPAVGLIQLKNERGEVKKTWTIMGAYLSKYVGPELDANNTRIAVQRIEMIYGGA